MSVPKGALLEGNTLKLGGAKPLPRAGRTFAALQVAGIEGQVRREP